MSVDRQKTPESEIAQVQFANKVFDRGTEAQAKVSAESIGDYRRSNQGKNETRINASSAKAAASALMKRRKTKSTRLASSQSVNTDIRNLSLTAPVKSKKSNVGGIVSNTASAVSKSSGSDNAKGMDDFVRTNERIQAIMDGAVGAISAYAHSEANKSDYDKVKDNLGWG